MTKFLFLLGVPILYILSGIGTTFINLVHDLAYGLVKNVLCELYIEVVGINVDSPL